MIAQNQNSFKTFSTKPNSNNQQNRQNQNRNTNFDLNVRGYGRNQNQNQGSNQRGQSQTQQITRNIVAITKTADGDNRKTKINIIIKIIIQPNFVLNAGVTI